MEEIIELKKNISCQCRGGMFGITDDIILLFIDISNVINLKG